MYVMNLRNKQILISSAFKKMGFKQLSKRVRKEVSEERLDVYLRVIKKFGTPEILSELDYFDVIQLPRKVEDAVCPF